MKDIIKKVLMEAEDDLDWVTDIWDDIPEIPMPDGKTIYTILIYNISKTTLDFVLTSIDEKWDRLSDYKDTIYRNSKLYEEAYIQLKYRGGKLFSSYGTTEEVATIKFNQTEIIDLKYKKL